MCVYTSYKVLEINWTAHSWFVEKEMSRHCCLNEIQTTVQALRFERLEKPQAWIDVFRKYVHI